MKTMAKRLTIMRWGITVLLFMVSALYSQSLHLQVEGRYTANVLIPSDSEALHFQFGDMVFDESCDTLSLKFTPISMYPRDTLRVFLGCYNINIADTLLELVTSNMGDYSTYADSASWNSSSYLYPGVTFEKPDWNYLDSTWIEFVLKGLDWGEDHIQSFFIHSTIPPGNIGWTPPEIGNIWEYTTYERIDSVNHLVQNRFFIQDSFRTVNGEWGFEILNTHWADSSILWSKTDTLIVDLNHTRETHLSDTFESLLVGDLEGGHLYIGIPEHNQSNINSEFLTLACYHDLSYWLPMGNYSMLQRYGFGLLNEYFLMYPDGYNINLTGASVDSEIDGMYWPLSIDDQESESPKSFDMSTYPNPFNSSFTINIPSSSRKIAIRIFNLAGQIVASQTVLPYQNKLSINAQFWERSGQASGIFIIEATTNDWMSTSKILLIK